MVWEKDKWRTLCFSSFPAPSLPLLQQNDVFVGLAWSVLDAGAGGSGRSLGTAKAVQQLGSPFLSQTLIIHSLHFAFLLCLIFFLPPSPSFPHSPLIFLSPYFPESIPSFILSLPQLFSAFLNLHCSPAPHTNMFQTLKNPHFGTLDFWIKEK